MHGVLITPSFHELCTTKNLRKGISFFLPLCRELCDINYRVPVQYMSVSTGETANRKTVSCRCFLPPWESQNIHDLDRPATPFPKHSFAGNRCRPVWSHKNGTNGILTCSSHLIHSVFVPAMRLSHHIQFGNWAYFIYFCLYFVLSLVMMMMMMMITIIITHCALLEYILLVLRCAGLNV
jgi:hypothetical protein